ncbi:putative lipoprotein [Streptomyces formicae]|uniref:Putative lipoprotein n=1 Tax=Streptomyces formicae TaxID=1616117 RepID=A0A291QDK6_9ACTN|nr:putative lipoprotein [Streptomyces formicae]
MRYVSEWGKNVKSAVSRAVVAVSVVAALGSLAACGGGSGDDAGKSAKPGASKSAGSGSDSASGSGSGADGGAGSGGSRAAAKLEKAALGAGDIKGYKVEKADEAAARPAGTVSPSVCAPLAAVLGPGTPPKADAHVGRVLSGSDASGGSGKGDVPITDVGLSAYARADATKSMEGLRTALKSKKCSTFGVGAHRFLGVHALPAPDKGDEAVSYKLAQRKGEFLMRESVTVVRRGGTLVVFEASNLYDPEGVQEDKEAARDGREGAGTPTADEDPKLAPAIVDAQLSKV